MARAAAQSVVTVLCDLDGVVWLAHRPIPGSVDAVAALRAGGCRVLFVTNNSFSTRAEHVSALAAIGIAADGDVVSSSSAAGTLIEPGWRVLVAGGPGVVEACTQRGADVVVNDGHPVAGPIDAVVVGMHRDFDYARLAVASAAVRRGARLIGTNSDSTFPTPDGLLPGGGSILAAIATASGEEPVVAGKPHPPMASVVAQMVPGFDPTRAWMIGDRVDTDGRFAATLGCRFALVRSGVTGPRAVGSGVPVAVDAADLAEVARRLVGPAGSV